MWHCEVNNKVLLARVVSVCQGFVSDNDQNALGASRDLHYLVDSPLPTVFQVYHVASSYKPPLLLPIQSSNAGKSVLRIYTVTQV